MQNLTPFIISVLLALVNGALCSEKCTEIAGAQPEVGAFRFSVQAGVPDAGGVRLAFPFGRVRM
ncbi:hypothetical protein DRA42_08505 [Ethanoligenens harbinense]|nr:hypothetical protein CXQ68_08480 [Ethanoligenens harbinense YUAN-3]AYF38916.1 hypothetical protein CXP51_08350 [Ethanoligenens harbinense]AYF41666.1 hypothetical protein CN246_08495 [Ethanoligenens harbinense]QCN92497.1 hypothetical protein DRA42_08505 [Ethanoligenens harbinense]